MIRKRISQVFFVASVLIGILISGIILIVLKISGKAAALPSEIGERIPLYHWIKESIGRIIDFELMEQFRDEIFFRIRHNLEIREDQTERYWIIREMQQTIDETDKRLQSGEYVVAVVLSVGGILLSNVNTGFPLAVYLTMFTLLFSAIVVTRVVLIEVLAFDPYDHIEESTNELAVRMAFNDGPLGEGSSAPIAFITLLIGLSRGVGYEKGMELTEWYGEYSHPDNGERWYVDSSNLNMISELFDVLLD